MTVSLNYVKDEYHRLEDRCNDLANLVSDVDEALDGGDRVGGDLAASSREGLRAEITEYANRFAKSLDNIIDELESTLDHYHDEIRKLNVGDEDADA